MAEFVKILLVEGHQSFEEAIESQWHTLDSAELIGTCSSPGQLYTFLRCNREKPDLVFLDADLDEAGSFHLSRWLKNHYPGLLVIGMMYRNEYQSIYRMVANGIDDHMYKESGMAMFSKVIDKYRRGLYDVVSEQYGLRMSDLGSEVPVPIPGRTQLELTGPESDLMRLVADQHSAREIAADLQLDVADVYKALYELCKKLHVGDIAALRRYALRYLYR